ncbi:MAG: hypothetical protein ACI97A_003244 [Planctomycetota bacterium]|jgi:hypothetical protein
MTLIELADEEARLRSELCRCTGNIEQKVLRLRECGVFEAYERIHAEYAKLANEGDDEALKRALFLQWYTYADASFSSGLSELDEANENSIIAILNSRAEANELDAELCWMLPWYFNICDWYFESTLKKSPLMSWLRQHRSEEFPAKQVSKVSLSGRGQMSEYWYRPDHSES